MLIQIICVSIVLFIIQFFFYRLKLHKLFLYMMPTISLCYMVYAIFQLVREQALVNSSIPLALKIIFMLLPIMLSLIGMIICIVKKYMHIENKGKIRFIVMRQFFGFLLVMLIILSVTVYTAQEYVVFFPNKSDQDTETLRNDVRFQEITIKDTYRGWLKESESSDTIIVYFGGNAQNTASTFLQFQKLGIFDFMENYSFLSIDYPSYGNSNGSLSQDSLFTMADDVMTYVQQRFPDKNIDLIGYSIGTGIASYAASHQELHKFVLIAPYNNGQDLFNTYFPIFHGPLAYLIRYPLTSDAYVKQVTCDTLILMSEADSIVPMRLSKKLLASFTIDPKTIVYQKEAHEDLVSERKPWEAIVDFLND